MCEKFLSKFRNDHVTQRPLVAVFRKVSKNNMCSPWVNSWAAYNNLFIFVPLISGTLWAGCSHHCHKSNGSSSRHNFLGCCLLSTGKSNLHSLFIGHILKGRFTQTGSRDSLLRQWIKNSRWKRGFFHILRSSDGGGMTVAERIGARPPSCAQPSANAILTHQDRGNRHSTIISFHIYSKRFTGHLCFFSSQGRI